MASVYNPISTLRLVYLLMGCLILFGSSTFRFAAEGRVNLKLLEASKVGEEEKMLVRARIGSRPPSCERRCNSCGHCEAVQVPAVPQNKSGRRHSSLISTINSRGEDTSNYKPMNWKCKCGDMILNP
ncbi:EPIDERMAL PATTERNING FACTOR-like protein 2 [Aristolochia californica]|uniref:EPIDERMAL PATTERNING FACTOR-like protein 2 n=1 Tax=Aristolochia californica TaxID=171875 RepID=UPI0035D6723C